MSENQPETVVSSASIVIPKISTIETDDHDIASCLMAVARRADAGLFKGGEPCSLSFESKLSRRLSNAAHELAAIHNDVDQFRLAFAYLWVAAQLDIITEARRALRHLKTMAEHREAADRHLESFRKLK